MIKVGRRQAVLDYIRSRHSAGVAEMSRKFFVSETSIRRDLTYLERAGMIRKTYGGAVILDGENEVLSLEAREQVDRQAKYRVAQKAAALVKNGQVIFLDSSSTSLAMVPYLTGLTALSVITNGLKTAAALTAQPQFRVYLPGGLLNNRTFSVHGVLACDMLKGMRADWAFISPKAIDETGSVYCADEEEAALRRIMMAQSDKTVLLCGSGKLGRHAAFRLCGLAEAHAIACAASGPDWKQRFSDSGLILL